MAVIYLTSIHLFTQDSKRLPRALKGLVQFYYSICTRETIIAILFFHKNIFPQITIEEDLLL